MYAENGQRMEKTTIWLKYFFKSFHTNQGNKATNIQKVTEGKNTRKRKYN